MWHLRFFSRIKYGKKLRKFKNIHKGERCFIVATGPSLKLDDVEKLKNEYTFGVNSIIGFFDKTDWRPDYYMVIDVNSYKSLDISQLKNLKNVFYHFKIKDYPYNNGYKVPMCGIPQSYQNTKLQKKFPQIFPWTKFSEDISRIVYDGRTVVYACLQFAAYMGFEEVYLLGTDCNYKGVEKHQKDLEYNNMKITDENVGDYMIECYKIARKYQDTHEMNIYNATRGGYLEEFERVNLDTII